MGTIGRYMGSNGTNAAQPSQPWGSTLTFQLHAGVSWVHGLRHGVTMHPRGRHLREVMTPWSHGMSHTQAREQLPPHQHNHDNWRKRWNKVRNSKASQFWKTWPNAPGQNSTEYYPHDRQKNWENVGRKDKRLQHYNHQFPLRNASRESSIAPGVTTWKTLEAW